MNLRGRDNSTATKIYNIHGFYVRPLSVGQGKKPYFIYNNKVEYEERKPSERAIYSINGQRCDDYKDDWHNMEHLLLLTEPLKATVEIMRVAPQANVGFRRKRNHHEVAVVHNDSDEDNESDGEANGNHQEYQEHNNQWRTLRSFWDPVSCEYCCCFHLLNQDKDNARRERSKCCNNGKNAAYSIDRQNDDLPPLSSLLGTLLDIARGIEKVDHMDLLRMNFVLDFAITAVDNPNGPREKKGIGGFDILKGGSIRLNGQVYHSLKDADGPTNLDFYMNGGCNAMDRLVYYNQYGLDIARMDPRDNGMLQAMPQLNYQLDEYLLRKLGHMLQSQNEIAQQLRTIGEFTSTHDMNNAHAIDNFRNVLKNRGSMFDVNANFRQGAQRSFMIYVKDGYGNIGSSEKRISLTNPMTEALCYPLLFPHGESGWHPKYPISSNQYIRSRLMQAEPYEIIDTMGQVSEANYLGHWTTIAQPDGTSKEIFMTSSRFRCFSILGQYWIVDLHSRIAEHRLNFQKSDYFQNLLRNGHAVDAQEANELHSKQMSSSVPGCVGSMRRKARDILQIYNEMGCPHTFITLTTNTEWPELKEALPEGTSAFEDPITVCRVFKHRLDAFLYNLRNGKYFGGRKTEWITHVIEYQERGLPHAHIVCRLENMPENEEDLMEWIDAHISCVRPPEPTEHSTADQIKLHDIITTKMTHKCGNYCASKRGCKSGFDKTAPCERTTLDERGYPRYKRGPNDLRIVSYNAQIVLDWDGHANVCYAASAHCLFYLFGYLYKGQKKVAQRLERLEHDNHQPDENQVFDDFISYRKISSMSAAWIALSYQTYPSPNPSVTTLYPRDEKFVYFHSREGRVCDTLVYFERPQEHFHLTFTEYFAKFSYSLKRPNARTAQYVEIEMTCGKTIFISQRPQNSKKIVYMYKPSSSIGEPFYIRLLLKHIPTTSFSYLKIVDNVEHESFQQAAIARGYVDDFNELKDIFNEIIVDSTPRQRRSTFAVLTLQGYHTRELYSDIFYRDKLIEDWTQEAIPTDLAINHFLCDLKLRLEDGGRTLEDYGFPAPTITTTLLDRERLRFNQQEMVHLLADLNARYPSTDEQRNFLDAVREAITTATATSPPKVFVLQGSGGVGKSNCLLKLIADARSRGKLVLGCAATGVAAAQFDDFDTAHKLFELPVVDPLSKELDIENRYESTLKAKPEKLELLQATNVIVWDEIFTNTRECLDAAARSLNDFVGKVIVLVGDIKQILGIPNEDSFESLTNSLVINSAIFKRATKHEFTINMRMLRAADFTESDRASYETFLKTAELIGLGLFNQTNVIQNPEPTLKRDNFSLILPDMPYVTHTRDMINHLYPNGWSPEDAIGTMMLATTNEKVCEWNSIIQELNPNEATLLKSKNKFADHDDDFGKLRDMINEVNMTNADKPDRPPHNLRLKSGDIVMLTHTLNRREKLRKNTLLQIMEICQRHIKIRFAGPLHNEAHIIPRTRSRLTFHAGLDMAITRTQFPLRLAYACTYNKSQSATLNKVGLDITHDLFAHGHLYVGLTRATNPKNIMFYTDENKLTSFPDCPSLHKKIQVNNIVHKEFITQVCQNAYHN